MNWLGEEGIPFSMIFTKSDKLKSTVVGAKVESYQNKMLEFWEELPQSFVTSSLKKEGKEELLRFIENLNASFK